MEDTLEQIAKDITVCSKCELRMTATNPVPGYGEVRAKYILVGEAPGRNEDEAGMPFVGAAGRKLDKFLELAGISLNDCYLSNVCRCRPPENRTPKKKEVKACKEYLLRELAIVKPSMVITLGSTPLSLFSPHGITQVHGCPFEVELTFENL